MADFVFNIAKGRVAELYNRVDTNDGANAVLLVHAWNSSETDATLLDLDDLSLVDGNANTTEASNSGYAEKTLTDSDLVALAPDDTNDRMDCDIGDQTWTAVAATGAWTDLSVSYDPDSTAGTDKDSNVVPCTWHDFAVTPNGGDITAQVTDFFRAS